MLSDVIRFLEDPRVSVKRTTGWYLILFVIHFSTKTYKTASDKKPERYYATIAVSILT